MNRINSTIISTFGIGLLFILFFSISAKGDQKSLPSFDNIFSKAVKDSQVTEKELIFLSLFEEQFSKKIENKRLPRLQKYYNHYAKVKKSIHEAEGKIGYEKLNGSIKYFKDLKMDHVLSKLLRHSSLEVRRKISKHLSGRTTIFSFENILSAYDQSKQLTEGKTLTGGMGLELSIRDRYISMLQKILKNLEVKYDKEIEEDEFIDFCKRWWKKHGVERMKETKRSMYNELKTQWREG